MLLGFGGHKLAAGMSINEDELDGFIEAINAYAKEQNDKLEIIPLDIDCSVNLSDLTNDNIKEFEIMEPMGMGNSYPKFLLEQCEISEIIPMGQGLHTRIKIKQNNNFSTVNIFKMKPNLFEYAVGDKIDIVISAKINQFNGMESVSLTMIDIKLTGLAQQILDEYSLSIKLKLNEEFSQEEIEKIVPNRNEIAVVFKATKENYKNTENLQKLYKIIGNGQIHYCKMLVILMVLRELALINVYKIDSKIVYKLSLNQGKVDLEKSTILQNLKIKKKVK